MGLQECFRSDILPTLITRRVKILSTTGVAVGRPSWQAVSTSDPSGNTTTVGGSATVGLFAGIPILRPKETYAVGDWIDQAVPIAGTVCKVYAGNGTAGSAVYRGTSGQFLTTGSGPAHAILLETPAVGNNFVVNAMLTGF